MQLTVSRNQGLAERTSSNLVSSSTVANRDFAQDVRTRLRRPLPVASLMALADILDYFYCDSFDLCEKVNEL